MCIRDRAGRVFATGEPADVIRRETLGEVYDVTVRLVSSGEGRVPFVVADESLRKSSPPPRSSRPTDTPHR